MIDVSHNRPNDAEILALFKGCSLFRQFLLVNFECSLAVTGNDPLDLSQGLAAARDRILNFTPDDLMHTLTSALYLGATLGNAMTLAGGKFPQPRTQ